MKLSRRTYILLGCLPLALGVYFGAYAINSVATGYKLDVSTYTGVFSNGGTCTRVDNNGSAAIFVPTATTAEMNSFVNHVPAGISVTDGLNSHCGSDPDTCTVGEVKNPSGCIYPTNWSDYQRDCADACEVDDGNHYAHCTATCDVSNR